MSDAASTTDPRTDPGWTSVARSEEFGVTVELGHIDGTYFWVEVAWSDEDLEQAVDATTLRKFKALLRVSAWPFDPPADRSSVDASPMTDLRTEPGWAPITSSEELGITVELGRNAESYFCVESIWGDENVVPISVFDGPVTDSWSTTDPKTEPGWTSIAKSEELGMTVELGHVAGSYFWIEVARRHLVSRNTQSTPEQFKALHERSAHPIDDADSDFALDDAAAAQQAVQNRLEELLHELCKNHLEECLQLRLDGRLKTLLDPLTYELEELIESAIEDGDGIGSIQHPAVDLWHFEDGAGAFWEVWRVGNRWFHWSFPGTQSEGEFSDEIPPDPPKIEAVPFDDWSLRNDVGPLPRAGTFERIGMLEAWNDSWEVGGEVAPPLEIVRRTAKTAKGQILVLDRDARLSWGEWQGSARVASFASIEELLAAVELPSDWFTSGRRASLSIIEPYYSQLSEPELPLCADHRQPSILLGEEGDPGLFCMRQLCLHLEKLTRWRRE